MLQDMVSALTDFLGVDPTQLWKLFQSGNNYGTYQWDYGTLTLIVCATAVAIVIICQFFRFLRAWLT